MTDIMTDSVTNAVTETAAETVADDERIREAAHKIWEEVGHPTDQAQLHWELAQQKIEDAERETAPPPTVDPAPVLPILKSAPLV
jgi:Protein of unknown function (DUF2934)